MVLSGVQPPRVGLFSIYGLASLRFLLGVLTLTTPRTTLPCETAEQVASVACQQDRHPKTCAHCIWHHSRQKTHNTAHTEKSHLGTSLSDEFLSSFGRGHWVPMTSRSGLAANAGQWAHTHPSVPQQQEPSAHPEGTDRAMGLALCRVTHTLRQNTAAAWRLQQGKRFAQAGPSVSRSEVFHAQGHSLEAKPGSEYCTHETAFPIETSRSHYSLQDVWRG